MTKEPIKEPSNWMLFLGVSAILAALVLVMFADF